MPNERMPIESTEASTLFQRLDGSFSFAGLIKFIGEDLFLRRFIRSGMESFFRYGERAWEILLDFLSPVFGFFLNRPMRCKKRTGLKIEYAG